MRNAVSLLRKLLASVGDAPCGLCREAAAGSDGLCPACIQKLRTEEREPCPVCGKAASACICAHLELSPLPVFLFDGSHHRSWLAHMWYHPMHGSDACDHAATALLLNCKKRYSPILSAWIAHSVAADLAPLLPPEQRKDWLLTYPPRSAAGYRKYGFDQCEEIVRLLGRELGISVQKLLSRKGGAEQKTQQDAVSRANNISNAFAPHRVPKDCRVLLFDDIITTGATMREAAQTLALAGAACVFPVAFAKTIAPAHREAHLPPVSDGRL